jgi:hypothetical protein
MGPDEGKIVLHIIDNTHWGKADDRNCKYVRSSQDGGRGIR